MVFSESFRDVIKCAEHAEGEESIRRCWTCSCGASSGWVETGNILHDDKDHAIREEAFFKTQQEHRLLGG